MGEWKYDLRGAIDKEVEKSVGKMINDIREQKDNAMAMEFTRVICDLLKENGATVQMMETQEENHVANKLEVKYGVRFTGIDFSEHDKKVVEEKDSQIRELKRQIEDLEAIIVDGKKPDVSISENGVSMGCECGGYHLAKQRISELERDLKECKDEVIAVRKNRDEMMEGFRKGIEPYVDLCQMHEKISELETEIRNKNKEIIEKNERMIELIDELEKEKANKIENGSKINLNDRIKVKLTPLGAEIYYHQFDETNKRYGKTLIEPKMPRIDKDGYTEFQLWGFIELYGEYIGACKKNVIEPIEIIII